MFDPFDDEPADERPPEEAHAEVRPMSLVASLGWAFGATLSFVWLVTLTGLMRPGVTVDVINNVACQAIAYLVALFLILRVYAPQASIRRFLGLRPTHVAFYPLAIALGVALEIPINGLYEAIERHFPTEIASEDAMLNAIRVASTAERVAIGALIVVLGPLVEEILFRGALVSPLRRRYAAAAVATATAVLFGMAHIGKWQVMAPIAVLGLVLGFVRIASGSLVPSVLLHATFNAIPFYGMLTRAKEALEPAAPEPIPVGLALGSVAATGVLLVLVHYAARTPAAVTARKREA